MFAKHRERGWSRKNLEKTSLSFCHQVFHLRSASLPCISSLLLYCDLPPHCSHSFLYYRLPLAALAPSSPRGSNNRHDAAHVMGLPTPQDANHLQRGFVLMSLHNQWNANANSELPKCTSKVYLICFVISFWSPLWRYGSPPRLCAQGGGGGGAGGG